MRCVRAAALISAIAVSGIAAPALAAEEETAVEDARWYFAEGSAHYGAKRWSEALVAFERSYRIVDSPNTELMIARCLRELGRRAEAVPRFDHAAEEAKRRSAKGEVKYTRTADAATAEGATTRKEVGMIRIHVARPASVSVDGKVLVLGEGHVASILHDPGVATITIRGENGTQQKQSVTVLAGSTAQIEFSTERVEAPPPPVSPPPLEEPEHRASWYVPAAFVAGGFTVAGLGVFTGFGLSSQATFDSLATRCAPQCGPADRADADAGERDQVIANVGLGIAVGAAILTTTFIVLAITSDDRRPASKRAAILRW